MQTIIPSTPGDSAPELATSLTRRGHSVALLYDAREAIDPATIPPGVEVRRTLPTSGSKAAMLATLAQLARCGCGRVAKVSPGAPLPGSVLGLPDDAPAAIVSGPGGVSYTLPAQCLPALTAAAKALPADHDATELDTLATLLRTCRMRHTRRTLSA